MKKILLINVVMFLLAIPYTANADDASTRHLSKMLFFSVVEDGKLYEKDFVALTFSAGEYGGKPFARLELTRFFPLVSSHMGMTTDHYDTTHDWGGLSNVKITDKEISFDINAPITDNTMKFVAVRPSTNSDFYKASAFGMVKSTFKPDEYHKVEWKQIDSITLPYPID